MTFSFVVVSNQAQVKLPTGAKEPVMQGLVGPGKDRRGGAGEGGREKSRGRSRDCWSRGGGVMRVIHVPSKESLFDHERANLASEIVVNLNKLCRQKKAGLMDLAIVGPSGACPLCELSCVCLGPSCHGKKGELF